MHFFRLIFLLFIFMPSFASAITLKEKIGQMLILGFHGTVINDQSEITKIIQNYNIGGVIIFENNIETPQQLTKLNEDLQKINHKINRFFNRPELPLFISIDYEGGKVNRLKEIYGFPKTFSAKEIGQMSIANATTEAIKMRKTLNHTGFNLNFAPALDLEVNSNNPIIAKKERSFSAEPIAVSTYAGIFSKEYLSHNIICSYKHFPGHGSSTGDSHIEFVDVTETWHEDELLPYLYQFNLPFHCDMIMTSHIVNKKLDDTGMPATMSHKMLTDILRHKLKFNGVIITDDMQMKAIADHYSKKEAITKAINAGVDMLIFANQLDTQDPQEIIDLIFTQVQKGKISQDRIEDAYQHIVNLKRSI